MIRTIEQDPFRLLQIPACSDEQTVRAAYRKLVKECHPDQFQDEMRQRQAQQKLIELNLAYESALKLAPRKGVSIRPMTKSEILRLTRKLMDQGSYEAALRQLARAESTDAECYCLQGDILMKMKRYEAAHLSSREAIRQEPENKQYREYALAAAVAMKKHPDVGKKLRSWASSTLPHHK